MKTLLLILTVIFLFSCNDYLRRTEIITKIEQTRMGGVTYDSVSTYYTDRNHYFIAIEGMFNIGDTLKICR